MSSSIVPNASEVPGPDVEITPLPGYPVPLVAIRLCGHPDRLANVSRADFLAGVETECGVRIVPADAIVIERADVPKVLVSTEGVPSIPGVTPEIKTQSAEKARYLAACWLALAEYLAAHPPTPPVNEADVEALAVDLFAARWPGMDWNLRADPQQQDYRTMARTLIADGWGKR